MNKKTLLEMLEKMDDEISEFCQSSPASGFEIDYLKKAAELKDLYAQAKFFLSEGKENEAEEKLQELCRKVEETASISPERVS